MFKLTKKGKKMNIQYKQIKKLVKILAKAAKRRNQVTRAAKVEEMDRGLTAMTLIVCREKRDRGLSSFSYETLDAVNKIIQTAKISRSKEIVFG
jgi:chromatin segregation and condensation protein Rec8/ScpA/Scc1 (kleisin family)